MFFHGDIVDNFHVIVNSKPNAVYHNNNNNNFSLSFPGRKDLMVNEQWEVAVTSLSIPYWLTNPVRFGVTSSLEISLKPHKGPNSKVTKTIYSENGYYTSTMDFIDSLKLHHPVFVYLDDSDSSIHTVDFDNYFNWYVSPTTDKFILDTSQLFKDYPDATLEVDFGYMLRKVLQPRSFQNRLKADKPSDNRIRSCRKFLDIDSGTVLDHNRDGWYYTHKNQVVVHSNLTGSPENPQKIIFHNGEINNPDNHSAVGTVNLLPDRLEYHKVTLQQFSHMNFLITDHQGDNFNWLHNTPVTMGLHFRKRYYINLYK